MQFFTVLTLATAAVAGSHNFRRHNHPENTVSPTFSLGGGYNATVTTATPSSTGVEASSSVPHPSSNVTTSAPASESTVVVPIVVTKTECASTVKDCPARTSTYFSTSTPNAGTTQPPVTATVIPVPVPSSDSKPIPSSDSKTTTITGTSTQTVVKTMTGTLSSSSTTTITLQKPGNTETCVASTVIKTVTLPPVTVTVAKPPPPAQTSVPADTSAPVNSSVVTVPKPSAPYPTGTGPVVPKPTGTTPTGVTPVPLPKTTVIPSAGTPPAGTGTGTIPVGFPTGSPIAVGAAGKVGSSAFGLVAAVAVAAMIM